MMTARGTLEGKTRHRQGLVWAVIAVLAWQGSLAAAEAAPRPARLQAAPLNTWVKVSAGVAARRSSPGLLWLPGERRFLLFGGAMGMAPKSKNPYSEMTFNPEKSRWENRFPKGKEGAWGALSGPAKAPKYAYGASNFKDVQGNVRPNLGHGYDRHMFLYQNFAWDSERKKVIVAWQLGHVMTEYDPSARTWTITATAKETTEEFWNDALWGAICYDPVNKEVLGGQGRWAFKDGKWRRLAFGNKRINALHERAVHLHGQVKDLVGRARSRYYFSETPEEAKVSLAELAGTFGKEVAAFAAELTQVGTTAKGHEQTQLAWAKKELGPAEKALGESSALLKGKITPQAIRRVEDARDALAQAKVSLSSVPPRRALSPLVYDAKNKKIVMFGGDRLDVRLADTWVYDCKTRQWEERRPKRSPSPRAGHGLAYLPKSGKVLLVDGYGIGSTSQSWLYDVAKNEWGLLAEGGKRPLFTNRPHYSWMPGPLAAISGDIVLMIGRREGTKAASFNGTWMARIDASKIDAAGTKKLGVPPFTVSAPAGGKKADPDWYERTGPPPDPAAEAAALKNLPPNTWVRRIPPNNPNTRRDWGTVILDTARDQLLQYNGGHSCYCGTNVLHYSIKTNRCSSGTFLPEFTLNWNASMLGPPYSLSYGGRPHCKHGRRGYGFDPASKKMLWFSEGAFQADDDADRFFIYDPLLRDWKGPIGRLLPSSKFKGSQNFICRPTPEGMIVWVNSKLVLKLDPKTMTFKDLKLSGKLPRMRVDTHGLAYDAKRKRLLFFPAYGKGAVSSGDMQSGAVVPLNPAGKGFSMGYQREATYLPNLDMVMMLGVHKLSDGKNYWFFYDCAKNAWAGIQLDGNSKGRYAIPVSTNLGLSYDPKRKLVWVVDNYMRIWVLRLDLKSATIRPLKDEPPPAAKKK